MSLNNSSIVSFFCFTKTSRLELRLTFEVCGREIGRARQTFQSGSLHSLIFACGEVHSEVHFGASDGQGFLSILLKTATQMVLVQGHGAAAAGSGQSGTGKIFSAHYKECRLDKTELTTKE